MNALVRFPDAESRRTALKLLGAEAAVGAEGWSGRLVVLSDGAVHQLRGAGIPFHIVEWIKGTGRAESESDPVVTTGRGPRSNVAKLSEVVDLGDAAISRYAKGWTDDVYEASHAWKANVSHGEWELAQMMNPLGCFLAWRDEKVVGVIATIEHFCGHDSIGWIGEFHVRPQELLGGAQSALLDRALRHLEPECATIESHVDQRLVSLFERRGFGEVGQIHRWRKRRNTIPVQLHPAVRGYDVRDIARIAVLDQKAVGYLRGRALYDLRDALPDLPLVYRRGGRAVSGHGCARRGEFEGRIGPVVSQDTMGAKLLIRTLLQKLRDRPLVWDIPAANGDANSLAEEFGFHPAEPLLVMRRGNRSVSEEAWVYATGGPLVG